MIGSDTGIVRELFLRLRTLVVLPKSISQLIFTLFLSSYSVKMEFVSQKSNDSEGSTKSISSKSTSNQGGGTFRGRLSRFYNFMKESMGVSSKTNDEGDSDVIEEQKSLDYDDASFHPEPILTNISSKYPTHSIIFTQAHAKAIQPHLPEILRMKKYSLVYSMYNHGSDLTTFYNASKGKLDTLLIIQTLEGSVFGGYSNAEWRPQANYFGSGESFLFSFDALTTNDKNGDDTIEAESILQVHTFRWTYANTLFCFASHEKLAMGGGGDGFGLVIDKDFSNVTSSACQTYGNTTSLDSHRQTGEEGSRILNLELWSLQL